MRDLIDRQAAIDAVRSYYDEQYALCDSIEELIEKLPSAQPEIIRCKDCKWYKTNYSWNGKEHKVCVIEPYEPIRKGDDFCSRGERRTDEAD